MSEEKMVPYYFLYAWIEQPFFFRTTFYSTLYDDSELKLKHVNTLAGGS